MQQRIVINVCIIYFTDAPYQIVYNLFDYLVKYKQPEIPIL